MPVVSFNENFLWHPIDSCNIEMWSMYIMRFNVDCHRREFVLYSWGPGSVPPLQDVCDVGNITDTDIEIDGNTVGLIMTSTDGTRHRVTMVDDWLWNYNLDIWPTLP